jgi:hypothetical protein
MNIRERYQKYVQAEIKENANPYPTGIQAFTAGVESEFQRVLDVLQDHVCPPCERGQFLHDSCEALLADIELLKETR